MPTLKRVVGAVVVAAIVTTLAAGRVQAGPFPAWEYRATVGIDNTSGSAGLTDFPLPVALNAANFDFSKAKANGSDIRFSAPDGTVLSYEIETWDSAGKQAVLWVKAPQIDAGSDLGRIYLHHGNPAAADAQDAPGVWSNGYKGVWHLGGTGTASDSTGGGHSGTVTGGGVTSAAGIIGDGRSFDSSNARIEVPQHAELNVGDDISLSYWMQGSASQPGGYTRVMSKNTDSVYGWEFQRGGGTDPHQNLRIDTSAGNNQVKRTGSNAFDDTWRFIGFSLDGGAYKGYLDGNGPLAYSYNHGGGFSNTLPFAIGARTNGANQFSGLIDEVRFSDAVRSEAWMNAEYRAQSGQMTSVARADYRTGIIAEYSHEDAGNRLRDMTGNGHDATNGGGGGGVAFVPAADPQGFDAGLGTTVGSYVRTQSQYLGVPGSVVTEVDSAGDSFTFTALVNKNDAVMGGYRSILSSDRFRYQWSTEGTTQQEREDNGRLRIDVTGGGGTSTSAGFFDIDQWYFSALVYDAATNRGDAYLIPASDVLTTPAFSFTPTSALTDITAFRIGGDGLSGIGGLDGWDGQIDNGRFYAGALTKSQLREVFRTYKGGPLGSIGLVAKYGHEGPDPLTDDTGHGLTLTNRGGVSFVAPPSPGSFDLGTVAGEYPRTSNGALDVPELHTPGDDFTFLAMVRKNSDETGGHQSILSSNRFRFQFRDTGTTSDGAGTLRLDVNGAGASGPGESGDGTFATEEWYFVALTYDASTKSIDAYLQPDSPVFFGPGFTRAANGAEGMDDMTGFRIGSDGLSGIGGTDAFGGHIDGARFYDRAFTKRELRDAFRTLHSGSIGPSGLVAKYGHEGPNPLSDDTGHGVTLHNRGAVAFGAPPSPGSFDLGAVAGAYPDNGNGSLDVPQLHTPGDDFTFAAMVRVDNEGAGYQTILGSDRFRFQFYPGASATDGAGALRLDVNGAGASGPANGADGTFATGQWHFVALTYDAATATAQAYLQPDSPVFVGAAFTRTANGAAGLDDMARFRIGGDGLSGIGGWDAYGGHIDGVRFYDRALTSAELRDLFGVYRPGPLGPFGGLVARYDHDGPDPLADDSGHGITLSNRGGVAFVAPPDPANVKLGSVVGHYPRSGDGALDVLPVYTAGEDFTFTAMVRKDSDESGGHQSILGSDRFRFQFRNTGTVTDGAGTLRLDVNGAGASGPGESGDGTFLTEEWYFVALRYDASTKQIDAFLQEADTQMLGAAAFSRTANGADGIDDMLRFRIGADGLSGIGSFDPFGGWIDGARFYDAWLSDAELGRVYADYVVPEPLTLTLLGLGSLALGLRRRRKRSA